MRKYQSFSDALRDLQNRGYQKSFEEDECCVYCRELRLRLVPEEFSIDEVHHFENAERADRSLVMYAITSSRGIKGVVVNANENL